MCIRDRVLAAWVKKDRELLKDAVYVGTSVAGAFVVTYGLKYLIAVSYTHLSL